MKAMEIVRYFVRLNLELVRGIDRHDNTQQNEPITQLKIQKLLYYAQGLGLVYLARPLFEEEIEAWQHGPVVRDVYNNLSKYGKDDLQTKQALCSTEVILGDEEKSIVEMTFREYGRYTASWLRHMTHKEPLWMEAWKKGKNTIIPREAMRIFFENEQKRKANYIYEESIQYRCLFN